MAVVVVGGSGKDVGKTGLVCAVISALREFCWTAVKITGHDYEPGNNADELAEAVIHEEMGAGEETDTARYLAAGARRALLVTRADSTLPIDEIRRAIGQDRNVIFESNRIVDFVEPDVCIALVGRGEKKPSFERLLRVADAAVSTNGVATGGSFAGIPWFELESVDRLSSPLSGWLRERLAQAAIRRP